VCRVRDAAAGHNATTRVPPSPSPQHKQLQRAAARPAWGVCVRTLCDNVTVWLSTLAMQNRTEIRFSALTSGKVALEKKKKRKKCRVYDPCTPLQEGPSSRSLPTLLSLQQLHEKRHLHQLRRRTIHKATCHLISSQSPHGAKFAPSITEKDPRHTTTCGAAEKHQTTVCPGKEQLRHANFYLLCVIVLCARVFTNKC